MTFLKLMILRITGPAAPLDQGPDNHDQAVAIGALFPPDNWSLLLKTDGGSRRLI